MIGLAGSLTNPRRKNNSHLMTGGKNNFEVTLWLLEKRELFSLLKRPPRNPPCPPLQRGVGGDFSDGFPNRYGLAKFGSRNFPGLSTNPFPVRYIGQRNGRPK